MHKIAVLAAALVLVIVGTTSCVECVGLCLLPCAPFLGDSQTNAGHSPSAGPFVPRLPTKVIMAATQQIQEPPLAPAPQQRF